MNRDGLFHAYLAAKQHVLEAGFEAEVAWQESMRPEDVTESVFLRESAWVILSCGFRERIVREQFPHVSDAFLGWSTAKAIWALRSQCRRRALEAFRNPRKIDGILAVAELVANEGFRPTWHRFWAGETQDLRRVPFLGPVTLLHLAKNLGLRVAKPDRHLCRVAAAAGCASVEELCGTIACALGDSIPVVDLVLWRFATLEPEYEEVFRQVARA